MEDIVGKQVRFGKDVLPTQHVLESGAQFFAIYFGAHWAPPCRLFTPALSEFYTNLNRDGKKFEIFFCSIDGNEEAFERNYREMPFCAIPYTEDQRIQNLKQRFGVNGIPTLVVLDAQGETVSFEGRTDI